MHPETPVQGRHRATPTAATRERNLQAMQSMAYKPTISDAWASVSEKED